MRPTTWFALVYGVYGLSFLIMAAGLAFSLPRTAPVRLMRGFWLLALFGLTHGVKEWCDLYTLCAAPVPYLQKTVTTVFLVASYAFLLQFGLHSLLFQRSWFWAHYGGVVAATVVLLCLAVTESLEQSRLETVTRLSLAVPGGLLGALAFWRLCRQLAPSGNRTLSLGARIASIGFLSYAVLLAVQPEIPLSLFAPGGRTLCALVISAGTLVMLRGFWVTSAPSALER